MILSISNFNRGLLLCAIALFVAVHFYAEVFFPLDHKIDYQLRDEIRKTKPDIVLLGGSPLRRAVDEKIVEKQLLSFTGRTFKVILDTSYIGPAHLYLILRNQICGIGWKPAVGLIFPQDRLTLGRYKKHYRKALRRQLEARESLASFEPGKKNKRLVPGLVPEILIWHIPLLRNAEVIAENLLHLFVTGVLGKIAPSVHAENALNQRFRMGRFREDAGPLGNRYVPSYDFDKDLKMSFLPGIVALKHQYHINLFVVSLPTYPLVESGFSLSQKNQYYIKLENYLRKNGIKYIPFWEDKEFSDPALFKDSMHFRQNVRFCELLARALVAKDIVR